VACLYRIFGEHDWLGRLVSAFFGAWGALFLFGFVRRRLGDMVAVWSGLLVSVIPVHLFHTRAFQPEAMALWGLLGGLYFVDRWLTERRTVFWLAAVALGSLAPLLKLNYLYLIGPLFALLGWDRRPLPARRWLALGGAFAGVTLL